MSKLRIAACLVLGATFIGSGMLPASATHQPRQAVPGADRVDTAYVGLDDNGVATAVWDDALGTLKYSSRLADGKFGTAVSIPGSLRVSESAFDSSHGGSAIAAWIDTSGDEPQIRASVKLSSNTGFRTHQVVSTVTAVNVFDIDTAISGTGRAAIVWTELQSGGVQEIRGALSNDAGVFGAPVTIATGSAVQFPSVDMAENGSAMVVWDLTSTSGDAVMAAGAPAGGPFGAERLVATLDQGAGEPQVAVNSAGRVFVAYEDTTPDPCPSASCAIFWVEMKLGTVTGAFTDAGGVPPNAESGYGPGSHEVALDESGKAAILLSASTPDGYAILARVSDAAGTFGPLQVLSPEDQQFGPGVALNEMELAAGGGEFTAIWVNDHNADGQLNEAYVSSSANSTFGTPDQISDPSDGFLTAYVARNGDGESIGVYSDSETGFMFATPVVLTGPAEVLGTNGADRLSGTSGADVARMGAGNDRFNGKGGNDQIFGEAGNDFLDGGAGRNVINGGPGRDTCVKRSKRDRLVSCERVRRNH
jgi:hypothetical protein